MSHFMNRHIDYLRTLILWFETRASFRYFVYQIPLTTRVYFDLGKTMAITQHLSVSAGEFSLV